MLIDEIMVIVTSAVAIISLIALVGGGVALNTARTSGWKIRVAATSMLSGMIGLLASIVMVIVCIALSKSM